ncbi:bifunctional cytidylyltransferase/SDR family oxidoreductase [Nonomuraea sp. NN258]|uniref:bifunctional cytidylyltransferase/SDR family oxidoreductase n=1 Tax=Nonomuraea antri TaxID=2730852 RepID=UPI00156A1D5B|nr:bifunctional cytidylyltransferase/SDR family oxidoreductase [Nonomuraea antri]NRQ36925.1 bifunctional cytidylyltransferase/SDR family oxidoreductase [Nonomuraea antri]
MDSRLRTVGVVLAGGVGQRVGLATPKQLVKVAGRAIIEHTLALFESAPEVDEVVVLMTPGYADQVREIVARGGFSKVSQVVDGGASRTESTWRALEAVGRQECDVLLHDAVRPLLEPRIITDCVRALRTYEAVDVAIPSSDTMIVAAPGPDGEVVRDSPDRRWLRRAQTPQCFRLSVIRDAYQRAFADPEFERRPATDDCGVVLRYRPDVPIFIVPGSEHNMKVTHPADLLIADRLFQLAAVAPVPADRRAALDGSTVVVFGGNHGVGAELAGLAGAHGARVHAFSRAEVRVDDPHAVAKALAHVGTADYVVNAAGVAHEGRLAEASDESVAATVGVTYLGAINVARAAHAHVRRSLLFYTSPGHLRGRAGRSLHSSATAAVANLAQALAEEWAPDGIRVNCVNPLHTGQSPRAVAQTSLDVLISGVTGQVIDVRVDAT